MNDRDELKEKIARAISREDGIMAGEASDFSEWHWEESLDHAEGALAVMEEYWCQANTGMKGETSSSSALQAGLSADAERKLIEALNVRDKYGVVVARLVNWFSDGFCTHPFEIADYQAIMMDAELMDREDYQLRSEIKQLFSVEKDSSNGFKDTDNETSLS